LREISEVLKKEEKGGGENEKRRRIGGGCTSTVDNIFPTVCIRKRERRRTC